MKSHFPSGIVACRRLYAVIITSITDHITTSSAQPERGLRILVSAWQASGQSKSSWCSAQGVLDTTLPSMSGTGHSRVRRSEGPGPGSGLIEVRPPRLVAPLAKRASCGSISVAGCSSWGCLSRTWRRCCGRCARGRRDHPGQSSSVAVRRARGYAQGDRWPGSSGAAATASTRHRCRPWMAGAHCGAGSVAIRPSSTSVDEVPRSSERSWGCRNRVRKTIRMTTPWTATLVKS
jgi:hypothetical protein